MNEQQAVLVLAKVKKHVGRNYKSLIRYAWENGNYERDNLKQWEGQLQQIRNTFGPSWLVSAKPMAIVTVTIISIWSKIEGIEGKMRGRNENVVYDVNVPVCAEDTNTLEMAFAETNADDRPMGNKACSTSSGDIMVLKGQHYLVQGHGYYKITLEESEAIQKLTSRDTSFGYDFLIKNNLIPITTTNVVAV